MKKRAMVLGFVLGAALMTSASVYAAEAETEMATEMATEMTGAYEAYEEEGLSEEAQAAFDQAMESYDQAEALTPVQLIDTQLVSGMNYRILCSKETEEQGTKKVLLTIYKDLNGNCEVTDEQKVIEKLDQSGATDVIDFNVHVEFNEEDFELEDGDLTFSLSECILYDMMDIAQMEVGDVVEVNGEYVTIETMTEGEAVRDDDEGNQEKVAMICVNEGLSTEYTFYANEGGTWELRTEVDWDLIAEFEELAQEISDLFTFEYSSEE